MDVHVGEVVTETGQVDDQQDREQRMRDYITHLSDGSLCHRGREGTVELMAERNTNTFVKTSNQLH